MLTVRLIGLKETQERERCNTLVLEKASSVPFIQRKLSTAGLVLLLKIRLQILLIFSCQEIPLKSALEAGKEKCLGYSLVIIILSFYYLPVLFKGKCFHF